MQKTESRKKEATKKRMEVGDRLILELVNDDTGKTVLREEHEVVDVPPAPEGKAGTLEAAGIETHCLSREWFDPELEKLNEELEGREPEPGMEPMGGADVAAKFAQIGLDAAKLGWDIIKSNRAVADIKATTTSVLYKDTDGMDYQGAQPGQASSYTLTVRDSLIKSWKPIQATIKCEGTYRATPRVESVPRGYYVPAVNVYASRADVDAPCTLSAKAQVSDVSNLASGDQIDPFVTVLAQLDFGWLLQKKHLTLRYTARGSQGFALRG